jgi:two-component system, response regulator
MHDRVIVLVEDNANDEELTLRAFRKSSIANRIVVVRDGAEALDYFFARGAHAGRAQSEVTQLVLLDLKLPKIDGLDVLRALRADERTRLIPIVVLTSSAEEQDLLRSYGLGANSYVRKPVDFTQFVEAVRQLGLYWLVINHAAPPIIVGS